MASERVGVLVDMAVKGREAVKGAADDLGRIDGAAQKSAGAMAGLSRSFVAGAAVIAGAAVAAKQLYGVMREGAVLTTTQQRFDKLAASIGSTSSAMLGELRSATQGMISDMELMASASQIMSLKLADNEDQVVRLATVAGTLGWDMQQVILTFANMSTMRLDALGLSVEEVKTKAAELEAAGMSAQEAFKEAVILAGEARLDVGGVSESEQAFKRLDAAITNTRNSLSLMILSLAESGGVIRDIEATATRLSVLPQYFTAINLAVEAGVMSSGEAIIAKLNASGASTDELIKKIQEMEGAVRQSSGGWFYMGDTARMVNADIRNELEMTRIGILHTGAELRNLLGMAGQTDWMGGMGGEDWLPIRTPAQKILDAFPRGFAAQSDMALGAWNDVITGVGEATTAVRGYGTALSAAEEHAAALASANARIASAFSAEIAAKPEDGFITAEGLVNMEAANKALFEQAQAAGATAGQLALLGVATGQFTAEQAQAALKAAILQEKIKQLAAGVASGDLSIDSAIGGLGAFQGQLDSGQIAGATDSVEGLAQAAQDLATQSPYNAELSVESRAAMEAITAAQQALTQLAGTYHINLVTTNSNGTTGTNGTGPDDRSGPPLKIVEGDGRNRANVVNGQSGGASYNVSVVNYVNGNQQSRSTLDDVTTDKIKAALGALGVRS